MRIGLGLFADRWNVSVQEEPENIMYNLTKTMIEGLSVEDRQGVVKTGNSHKPAVRFRKNNEPNQGHLERKHSILYHFKNKGNNTFLNSLVKQAKIPVILLKTKVCLKHSLSKIFYPHNNCVHHPSE